MADGGVVGQLHLVDGDAVGVELDGLLDRRPPLRVVVAEHPRDEVDVDLGEAQALREAVGPEHLGRAVGAAVQLEDAVVVVLDAEAQPRHPQLADLGQLRLGEGARLALEGDLLGVGPRRHRREPVDEAAELPHRQERRRAAPEVHEPQGPPGDGRLRRVELPFPAQEVQVLGHLARVLAGVHAVVAEVAPLPAEGDVQVEPEGDVGGGLGQRREGVGGHRLVRPRRERGVVGDEVAADLGLLRRLRRLGHLQLPSGGGDTLGARDIAVRASSRVGRFTGCSRSTSAEAKSANWPQCLPRALT